MIAKLRWQRQSQALAGCERTIFKHFGICERLPANGGTYALPVEAPNTGVFGARALNTNDALRKCTSCGWVRFCGSSRFCRFGNPQPAGIQSKRLRFPQSLPKMKTRTPGRAKLKTVVSRLRNVLGIWQILVFSVILEVRNASNGPRVTPSGAGGIDGCWFKRPAIR